MAATTTIDARDAAWGAIYNLCTVRSDTFVVYGYLEAVRVNPRYVAAGLTHNNGSDWYDTSAAATTDDPNNGTIKNQRLARLRWVAIVDRSFCNYGLKKKDPVTGNLIDDPNFQIPRVVAIKDLPR